jgi:uncharacterized protein (TIGR00255 family)
MTGYGKGEYKQNGLEITCEIKTVNNRYLDAVIKAPRMIMGMEDAIRSKVREKLTRGHADVFLSIKDKREKEVQFTTDLTVAKGYVEASKLLQKAFPFLENDFTITSLLRSPEVLKQEDNVSVDEEMQEGVFFALAGALEKLNEMRLVEGEKLKADMLSRMKTIETLVEKISARAPLVAKEYKNKLLSRMKEYLEGVNPDESRLLTEVALFTDKSNIDEELTRLHSHIEQFRDIAQEGIVGRKLDFLVQEFNREANTTCSKSNDIEITRLGLALKNEIEKVREQVQNLE